MDNYSSLNSLLQPCTDIISVLSNSSSYLNLMLNDINWVGFYLFKNNELILGPFQGKPACTNIAIGKGVCGRCAEEQKPIIVDNVHTFKGHIACDSQSKSEIVIPIFIHDHFYGLLDVDSPNYSRFNNDDLIYLENVINAIANKIEELITCSNSL